ncbi:MAG: serine hydrolase domain-containing protein [Flavisolibacter sp.]
MRLVEPFKPLDPKEVKHYHNLAEESLNHSLLRTRFNGGVLIARNGTIVYEKYFGSKNLRGKDSIDASTPFQIASTSKTFTAAAILILVQEGKLRLDDSLSKFFPNLPYKGITLKMLLSHRSGLPNYIYYMEKSPWDPHKQATNMDVLNTLINWQPPRAYRPGIQFHYCNTNYVLLALIVEMISRQAFPAFMKQHIFDPLGMHHTFVHSLGDTISVIQSYQPRGRVWTMDYSDGPYGDKNIYSTPEDLLKWDQALYREQILNKQTQEAAFTPYSNERPGRRNYGFGWRLLILPGNKKIIYHNGHWHGFNSAFVRLVNENATIIILSNRFNKNVYTTAKKLYNLFGNYDGNHEENGEE